MYVTFLRAVGKKGLFAASRRADGLAGGTYRLSGEQERPLTALDASIAQVLRDMGHGKGVHY